MNSRSAYALLHFTVFLWGLTAILGRSISVSALTLVWYRAGIVVLVAAILRKMGGRSVLISPKRAARLGGIGLFVGIHWILFYGCIKLAGVAIAVLCLSTLVFFTALLEPLVFRRKMRWPEFALGLVAVVGVFLLLQLEQRGTLLAWCVGVGSSLFSALFGTLNGRAVRNEEGDLITIYELAGAWALTGVALAIWPTSFVAPWHLSAADAIQLLILAIVCTLYPWRWSLRVLRVLPPYVIALAVLLEPVYSMIIARIYWPESETLSLRFYFGAFLLIALGPINVWIAKRFPQ